MQVGTVRSPSWAFFLSLQRVFQQVFQQFFFCLSTIIRRFSKILCFFLSVGLPWPTVWLHLLIELIEFSSWLIAVSDVNVIALRNRPAIPSLGQRNPVPVAEDGALRNAADSTAERLPLLLLHSCQRHFG